jgi:hypothetical protein
MKLTKFVPGKCPAMVAALPILRFCEPDIVAWALRSTVSAQLLMLIARSEGLAHLHHINQTPTLDESVTGS